MGEQGVPVIGKHDRVPGMGGHGVPGIVSTKCLGWVSTEYRQKCYVKIGNVHDNNGVFPVNLKNGASLEGKGLGVP